MAVSSSCSSLLRASAAMACKAMGNSHHKGSMATMEIHHLQLQRAVHRMSAMSKLFIHLGVFAACLPRLQSAGLVEMPAFALTPVGCCPPISDLQVGANVPLVLSTVPACWPCATCEGQTVRCACASFLVQEAALC